MQTDHSDKNPRVGVGVAVIRDGKALFGKRKGAHGAGTWSFPGGHLEFGETVEECAARELLEETGLQAKTIVRGPWTNDVMDQGKHYVTLFMFVTEFSGEPELIEPHKCEGWEWFEWNAFPEPLFHSVQSFLKLKIDLPKPCGVEK